MPSSVVRVVSALPGLLLDSVFTVAIPSSMVIVSALPGLLLDSVEQHLIMVAPFLISTVDLWIFGTIALTEEELLGVYHFLFCCIIIKHFLMLCNANCPRCMAT